MRQVISAAPVIDVSAFAARLAGSGTVITDPSPALCRRYGYQTLYEIPAGLQRRLRLELIEAHARTLASNPMAVCDHSVFAWLADWMRWLWGETPTEEWERVIAIARLATEHSEVIHHVTAGPRAAYDGYRWLDARNAAQLDPLMRSLYRQLGCEARVKEIALPP